ncbi:hypothetical protein LINPERHAP1_LOCUS22560 [Linum perenne]
MWILPLPSLMAPSVFRNRSLIRV